MTYTYGVSGALATVPIYLEKTKGRSLYLAHSFRGFIVIVQLLCFQLAETHHYTVVDSVAEATHIMAAGFRES